MEAGFFLKNNFSPHKEGYECEILSKVCDKVHKSRLERYLLLKKRSISAQYGIFFAKICTKIVYFLI